MSADGGHGSDSGTDSEWKSPPIPGKAPQRDPVVERLKEIWLRQAHESARTSFWFWDNPDVSAWNPAQPEALIDPLALGREGGSSDLLSEAWKPHAEDLPRLQSALRHAESARELYRVTYRVVDDAGTERTLREIGAPCQARDGRSVAWAGLIQDVSDLVQMERQFQQSQKLDLIGRLTGGVSHDFNNILSIVVGNLELLLEDTAGFKDDQREMLQIALSAATRGAGLTQRLLAFARQQPLKPVAFEPRQTIADFQQILKNSLKASIRLELGLEAESRHCYADINQFENALLNLVVNARDAMPTGGTIRIECENIELGEGYAARHDEVEPGRYVLVSVSDDGSGIEANHLDKVMEPFFTTRQAQGGSGLGLSSVLGFAKQSGGHFSLYSEPGVGTTAKLYLPVADDGEPFAGRDPGEVREPLTGSGRIVVIDDDRHVRETICGILARYGYVAIPVAGNRGAAEAVLDHRPFDLVITDMALEDGLTGRQLLERVFSRMPQVPVLFVSGFVEGAVVMQNMLRDGEHFLQKPFRSTELARRVKDLLNDNRAPSED